MPNPISKLTENRLRKLKTLPYSCGPNPAFIIDTDLLEENAQILESIKIRTGAKILLAQKAFSCFSTYPILKKYLDGTSSSGYNEAYLADEYFGKEIHVYSPAYTKKDIKNLADFSHTLTFNSIHQLAMGIEVTKGLPAPSLGLRVNPEFSTSTVQIYDPCSPNSRLGVIRSDLDNQLKNYPKEFLRSLSGLHFHSLFEENSYALEATAEAFELNFKDIIQQCKWLNFGGGHNITRPDYDIERLCKTIDYFQNKYSVQIYLEPGEAVAYNTGVLNTKVLDVINSHSGQHAILNISATCHMPDILEMPYRPNILNAGLPSEKKYTYQLGGLTCLAGDVIGKYSFDNPIKVNDTIQFIDMSQYTMVKTTTFNGVSLPAICLHSESKGLETIRIFDYSDFKNRLS